MPSLIRSASLTNFTEIAQQCGLDPLALLRAVGLPVKCLDDPDMKISTHAVVRLLEMAARQAAEPAFGLRMGESRRLSNLGPLGLLVRDEPSLRHALEAIVRHIRVHNEALVIRLEEVDQWVMIREEFAVESSESKRQATELAMAVTYRTLSVLMGSAWRPRLVCFTHSAPPKRSTHLRVFGEQVQFDHEFNGLVCRLSDLDQPNPSADPVMARYAQELVTSKSIGAPSFAQQVQQLILLLLPLGQCTADVVAQHMGCDRRTISRRLAAEGFSFHGLVDAHRRQIVQQCLLEKSRPLSQLAGLLGFSAPSAFSRWYRDQFGGRARDAIHATRAITGNNSAMRMTGAPQCSDTNLADTDTATAAHTRNPG